MVLKKLSQYFGQSSISKKLMLCLVTITLVVMVVFGIANYLLFVNRLNQDLDKRLTEDTQKLEEVLSLHIWNIDKASVNKVADSQVFMKSLALLRVSNNFGELMYEINSLEEGKDYSFKKEIITYEDQEVGFVEIASSTEHIKIAKNAIVRSTTIIILAVFFSVLLISFFVSRLISKPINDLTLVSEKIAAGDLNAKASVVSRDEIGKLARTFNEMTSKLQQEIFQHEKAEKELSQVNELRRKFLTIISHQLRTPLSASKFNLEMLITGDMGKVASKQLGLIEASHETINEVIRRVGDLLQVLDIEEGKISLNKQETSLQELVQPIINEHATLIEAKKIKLEFEPDKNLPKIKIDSEKISVVLNKLIGNSVAYTPEAGSIKITLKQQEDWLRFSIIDTGIGIPKSEQDKIFSRFFRASNAMKVVTDSSGVGLAIAKFFVEEHGGKIGFESEENKGSTFWFELPITNGKKTGVEKKVETPTPPIADAIREEKKEEKQTDKEKTKITVEDL